VGRLGRTGRWLVVVVWMAIIFLLSSIPSENLPMQYPLIPVIAHLLEYFVLAGLLIWASNSGFSSSPSAGSVAITFLVSSFYAFTDELHQAFVPNRVMDALDYLTDVIGITAACIVLPLLTTYINSRRDKKRCDSP
jgi:VanZ family protein